MYNNIGGKIKVLAIISFALTALAFFISGIALMADDDDFIFLGMLMMFGGPVLGWISSWLIYGFGELIVKATEIARNTQGGQTAPQAPVVNQAAPQAPVASPARNDHLQNLLNQGLISQDEYEQAMAKNR